MTDARGEPVGRIRGRTAYDDFLGILKKFRALSTSALGTGAAVPFVAYLTSISPPWPPGIMFLTALTELVCLIVVFQFLRERGRKIVNRALGGFVACLFVVSSVYLVLFSIFTFAAPKTGERLVKGFLCNPPIRKAYFDDCPLLNIGYLRDAQYTPELLWQEWSIEVMRVVLSITWLFAFVLLSASIGIFLVFQTKKASRRPSKR
jgi:hypothetical protein